jgi:hypothetical protein
VKIISLSVLLALASFISGLAQVKEPSRGIILFNGVVIDGTELTPVANVQITINKLFSSVSGSDGSFAFYVNRKDTVQFKALGYRDETIVISDTLKGEEFIAGVYLKGDTLEIGEVIIIPRYRNIKSEILNAPDPNATIIENARYNVAISAYQGRTTVGNLGDPASNYELLRSKQRMNAYSAGQIPPDQMVAISPFIFLPAAYLLVKGLPEKPAAFSPRLTDDELKAIEQEYYKSLRQKFK